MDTTENKIENTTETSRLNPWDELPADALRKVDALTEAAFQTVNTKEVTLATDPIKVPGQNYACVSYVSPEGKQKGKQLVQKIRGCFATVDECRSHIQRLIKLDPDFDIYICDMYDWCLIPPDPETCQDQNYQDEVLHSIISGYKKNQIYAKEHFEERKRELLEQAADELKKAALKKLELEQAEAKSLETGESQDQSQQLGEELKQVKLESEQLMNSVPFPGQLDDRTDRIVDITELEGQATDVGTFTKPGPFVTASELLESMMGCPK